MADQLSSLLADRAAKLVVGPPTDDASQIGPLVHAGARDHVMALIADAADHGAQLLTRGTADGLYVQPTVLRGVTPSMRIYHEETFVQDQVGPPCAGERDGRVEAARGPLRQDGGVVLEGGGVEVGEIPQRLPGQGVRGRPRVGPLPFDGLPVGLQPEPGDDLHAVQHGHREQARPADRRRLVGRTGPVPRGPPPAAPSREGPSRSSGSPVRTR
ncbi:aldehyde dehydrogenase family protein [Actinomadura physcomitrii]|uniref:aldehyde dehydrogenase family protein n=1 Tax=Actinomadura physcomitrii TaxID=2650748 RepID=UPI001922912E